MSHRPTADHRGGRYFERPIAITHANPRAWALALRNKRDDVICAVTEKRGMIGFRFTSPFAGQK